MHNDGNLGAGVCPPLFFRLDRQTERGISVFLANMATAAEQVLILYLMIAVGFLADKTGLYREKAARMTNDLLFYIVTPAVITQAFLSMELTQENVIGLFVSALCGFALHGVAILLSLPLFRGGEGKNAICKFASIYGNVGYMALPMAQAQPACTGAYTAAFAFTHNALYINFCRRFCKREKAASEPRHDLCGYRPSSLSAGD